MGTALTSNPAIKAYRELIEREIATIREYDVREFASHILDRVPEYFFTVPASSSGKYHPNTDLGEGGLVRHSVNVKRMLDHILAPEGIFAVTDREKDLLRLAALFHDCMKSGSQEMYDEDPCTKFMHPYYAAKFILDEAVECSFPWGDSVFIAYAIASHMGQWNTSNYDTRTLPKPVSVAEKALHLADYLASRKGIEMEIEPVI